MEKKKRVTMYDVARAANVTPQTVSRAFRNTDDISEETRKKILKIAEELHYVVNTTASSLRAGNSRLIVVVYDNLKNVYYSIMIDHLQTHLRRLGYSILMLSVPDAYFGSMIYKFAVSHNASGVVSFLEPKAEIEEMVNDFKIPILLVGRRTLLPNVDYIRTDDEEGGRLAAAWLAERGVRRFAYLSIEDDISCAQDRFSGFSQEIARRGLEPPVAVGVKDDSRRDSIVKIFSDPETAPDGIFCFSDMIAFELLYYTEALGLPPVQIVGFDCVQREIRIPGRFMSLGCDKNVFAQHAAEMIVSAIESKRMGGRGETIRVSLMEGFKG